MSTELSDLLSRSRRIHMLGVGGIGMAGLAFLLKERGHIVSGSDSQENRQTAWLRDKGISIQSDVPEGVDWMIRTRAVSDTHTDVVAARVPVSWRGEVLPELLRDRFTIAVSGTHGKTTTTAMIAQVLGCGYYIGGEVQGFDGTARDGEIMVVEADESDGTVAHYHPDVSVITNIEYDHMEHHDNVASFEGCFEKLISQTRQRVVYCGEDAVATRLSASVEIATPYDWRDLKVALPGRHNQLNAMAAMTVCKQWMSEPEIEQRLATLRPVKRRFERVFDGAYQVISDYAHHPTEIRALIQTARDTLKPARLFGVFQPHRYTRTQALMADFPPSFEGLDHLWLLPVYAASEAVIIGGRSEDLAKAFPSDWSEKLSVMSSIDAAWSEIKQTLREGDVLLIIGAGDIEKLAEYACQLV